MAGTRILSFRNAKSQSIDDLLFQYLELQGGLLSSPGARCVASRGGRVFRRPVRLSNDVLPILVVVVIEYRTDHDHDHANAMTSSVEQR